MQKRQYVILAKGGNGILKAGIVAWIEKSTVCHSCESRNPEKTPKISKII